MSDTSEVPQPPRRTPVWNLVKFLVIPLIVIAGIGFATLGQHDDRAAILDKGVVAEAVPTGNTSSESIRDGRHTVQVVHLEFSFDVDGETYTALGDQAYDEDSFDKDAALAANAVAEVHYLDNDPAAAVVLDADYR
ncbi:hypothetical protein ESZ53_05260 [Salinibacterium sp. UTAS2018]|uniref:hypothetical protein n=1 Tax=Salinibacterium sp. UTAS2018 TaxID=2508880 RepID=UPI001009668E|nr:hypothetical protein [Salinibacterium sp. UTAS2018]QAV69896.1 hypothetical protein ESZ53_05260 [Salinibacterium sp. UTAS2018]